MKKVNTAPIAGTQELLPGRQRVFDRLKNNILGTFRRHGFLHVETPVIDRTEILLAKAGGETEQQVYFVKKSGEANENSKTGQALRFDHTVPLARYVVEHESDLQFPFKATQIGRNFRGEHAQKGRFREFYQCDVDVIGRGDLALSYDADVIATMLDAYAGFRLKTPVVTRISNRKIVSGVIEALNLQEVSKEIFGIIDHAEKVPQEKTLSDLHEIGLSEENVVKITTLLSAHGSLEKVLEKLDSLGVQNELFETGIQELKDVYEVLEKGESSSENDFVAAGQNSEIIADLRIVRGLDYYTGTVFEFGLPEYPEIGSIGGGGRYENLTGHFSDQKFPGVGGSIGLTRLFYVLNEKGLLNEETSAPLDLMIIPISEVEIEFSNKLAELLRSRGLAVDVILTDKRLGDKMSYAAKLAKFGIVIGENEVETGIVKLKDFETGIQKENAADETLAYLMKK